MGILRKFLGGGPDEPPTEPPVQPAIRDARACELTYSEFANATETCTACGWPLGAHKTEYGAPIAQMGEERAPRNPDQQLILAEETSQRTATELITSAGNSVPALASALTVIAQRFEQSVQASHELNRGLAEFRNETVKPLIEELKFLRYNLGDRVNKTTTNMEVMVDQLDKTIWGALRASGLTDDQIRTYRTEHGMNPEAPSGQELEIHMGQHQALLDQVATLTAQNQRLLAQLGATHTFRDGEAGEWVYHPGCECQACTAQTVQLAAMQSETSMVNRVKAKPKDRRSKRRG